MKVLFQITLLLCTCSMYYNNELNDEPNDVNISDDRPQLTRTKLPIFPKISAKFIMQQQKLNNKDSITKQAITKKPIMMKFIPQEKNKQVGKGSIVKPTRRPVMKLRSYTMNTFSNHKFNNKNQDNNKKVANENTIVMNKSKITRLQSRKTDVNNITMKNDNGRTVPTTPINYYAEESRDRNEYIFLNVNSDRNIESKHDLLQPGDEDDETTTVIYETIREKRNINIIEEESKPTKYPGWKYNEHDTKMNNDRFYSNVNT